MKQFTITAEEYESMILKVRSLENENSRLKGYIEGFEKHLASPPTYDQGFHDGANKTAIELSKIDTVNLDYALIQKCSVCSVQLHPIHGANCLAPNCPNENYNGDN
tara:strand:+ start:199 stop:516 length:318 start_codon:yes stop_codon:yes gene_type:complete